MILSWLRRRRRRKLLALPIPDAWSDHLAGLPFFGTLDADEQARLVADARVLVAEKQWEGCGGQEITEEVQVVIAAQAALLLLNLSHEYYRRTDSVLVYPSTFVVPEQHRHSEVRGGDGAPVLGLAQVGGPVVLAWDSVLHGAAHARDGRNVVLHEFAHKLDMLDRVADGTPELDGRDRFADWVRVMSREFEKLREDDERGRRTLLDKYGATNPAEFFAVATECFFEKPRLLKEKHAELYGILQGYYRQDPAARRRPQAG